MHVILVRHGHAQKGYTDSQRPLTAAGIEEIALLAGYLAAQKVSVEEIWHSGILRATQTAEIIEATLNPAKGLIKAEHIKPDSSPAAIKTILDLRHKDLMIVSHLPYLEYLTNLLITGDMESDTIQYRPGTAVKIEKSNENWKIIWAVSPDDFGPPEK